MVVRLVEEDLERLGLRGATEAVRAFLATVARGSAVSPPRVVVPVGERTLVFTVGGDLARRLAGVRLYSTGEGQPPEGAPDQVLALLDLATGEILAMAEGATFGASGRRESPRATVHAPAQGVRIVVVQTASARIRLLRPDGKPFADDPKYAGVEVTFWRRGDFDSLKIQYRHADAGRFVLDDLEEGAAEVQIDTGDYVPVVRSFVAATRTSVDLGDIVLDTGLPVRGRVVGADGTPVAGALVLATPADGKDVWLAAMGLNGGSGGNRARTAEDGTFTLDHVAAGTTWLEAARQGLAGSPIEVTVAAGLAPVEIRVGDGAAVWCHLKTADGKPAADERLMATRWADGKPHPSPRRELRATGDDGKAGFRLTNGLWRSSLRTFEKGKAPGEIPLGEFTVIEGKTQDIDLVLPTR